MADEIKADFLKIATEAVKRGLSVTPLRGKAAFLPNWNNTSSADLAQIQAWAKLYPNSNVGVVRTDDYWMLDVDSMDWFMENAPPDPKTLIVKTGSGKLHYYFLHDDASRKFKRLPVMNPRWKSKDDTPEQEQKLLRLRKRA